MRNMIKIPLENFRLPDGLRFDYFICSSSFEERCTTISSIIPKDIVENVIIYHFENNYEISDTRLSDLKRLFQDKNIEVGILKKHLPLSNFDAFIQRFNSLRENACIAIDITTFTRENLLMLLRIASLKKGSFRFYFFYTPSEKYSSNVDISELWLSRGVKEIRSVFSYPGDFSPIKSYLLIILTGFEYERSQILIDIYEPTRVVLGKATSTSSINPELADINERNFNQLRGKNPYSDTFEFSCIDLDETMQIIREQIAKFENDYNIIIAPMNNKLSSLSVGLVALEKPFVQICYASTNQYNIYGYSSPSNFVYLINLSQYL